MLSSVLLSSATQGNNSEAEWPSSNPFYKSDLISPGLKSLYSRSQLESLVFADNYAQILHGNLSYYYDYHLFKFKEKYLKVKVPAWGAGTSTLYVGESVEGLTPLTQVDGVDGFGAFAQLNSQIITIGPYINGGTFLWSDVAVKFFDFDANLISEVSLESREGYVRQISLDSSSDLNNLAFSYAENHMGHAGIISSPSEIQTVQIVDDNLPTNGTIVCLRRCNC